MYDLSTKFDEFYRNKVVLSAVEQNELREKSKLNIKRLNDGLIEYNNDNNTNYKICENRIQGSMAMHTVVKNDENDYDIDVAIVFEKNTLADLGPLATRNMVANALKRKTKQFNAEPEVKTSCVRIKYADGYHVDFAIYRRYKVSDEDDTYIYEHAGNEWSKRDIKAINDWFSKEVSKKNTLLRKIVRLSKMFCKSKKAWVNMPSGLIQTILCADQFVDCSKSDEAFYQTMAAIKKYLEKDINIIAPVDNGRLLVTRDIDRQKINNWRTRLESSLKDMDILFDSKCTAEQALAAWHTFFNHDYWGNVPIQENDNSSVLKKSWFSNTEEFIENSYGVNEQYTVSIDCTVIGNGFSLMPIQRFMEKYISRLHNRIPHNFQIRCKVGKTNAQYDKVLWKVRNIGAEAEKRNDIRGQIKDRGNEITEYTRFVGEHYIECYLIKNGICVAIGHIKVPIAEN